MRSGSIKSTVCKWSEATTLHGVRYALNIKSHIIDRLLWFVVTAGAAAIAFYMSANIYLDWKNKVHVSEIK
jgi:hypothetical protein